MKIVGFLWQTQLTFTCILTLQVAYRNRAFLEFAVRTLEAWGAITLCSESVAFAAIDAKDTLGATFLHGYVFTELSYKRKPVFIHSIRAITKELFVTIVVLEAGNALYRMAYSNM